MKKTGFVTILIASFVLSIIFWLSGWIPSVWTGIAVVGAVIAAALLNQIPEAKLNLYTKMYLVWLLWAVGLPMIQHSLAGSAPITAVAVRERHDFEDLRSSELVRPQGLNALLGYRRMLDGVDDQAGLAISAECEALYRKSNGLTLLQIQQEVDRIGQEIDKYRQFRHDAGKRVIEDYPQPSTWLLQMQTSPPRTMLWLLGLGVAIAGLFAATSNRPGIAKSAYAFAFIVAIVFVLDRIFWGGLVSIAQIQNIQAKTAYVVIGLGAIATIVLGCAFGKRGLTTAGLVGGLLLGLFFVGYQAKWGNLGGKISNLPPTSGASAPTLTGTRSGSARTITAYYTADNRWTKADLPTKPLKWESSTDVQLKLSDGRIIDAPKDHYVKLGRVPGSSILVRGIGGQAGRIVFTVQ